MSKRNETRKSCLVCGRRIAVRDTITVAGNHTARIHYVHSAGKSPGCFSEGVQSASAQTISGPPSRLTDPEARDNFLAASLPPEELRYLGITPRYGSRQTER